MSEGMITVYSGLKILFASRETESTIIAKVDWFRTKDLTAVYTFFYDDHMSWKTGEDKINAFYAYDRNKL